MSEVPNIQTSLANIMEDVRQVAKKDRNTAQNFSFRGIDAVVNAVGPALRKHNVIVVPSVESYDYGTVTIGQRGTQMGHVRLTVRYTFHGPAGDSIDAVVVGEAMDSGDKATAKAMSVCFRTALLQALALPTDDVDPDAHSYERAPAPQNVAPEVINQTVARMNTTSALGDLDDLAAAIGGMNLKQDDRNMLRAVYLENKARLTPSTETATAE